jgi:CubicO group peptidase (beta-lactamase class C family)
MNRLADWIKQPRPAFFFWVLSIFVAFFIASCTGSKSGNGYVYQVPAELGDGWETASLADARLDSNKIAAMMDDIQDGGFGNLHSLLIVKDGKLVFEKYFSGHNPGSIDYVASVTKTVASITIGIAIDHGFIQGSDQYLADLLPSYADVINADPLKQKLQLWHILSMTSGLEWDEETFPYGDPRNDATAMERNANPVQFVLDRPVIRAPGSQFQYSGANSMLLSAILQEATGKSLAAFAKQTLFDPLGISQYRWTSYPDGHTNTDGGLSLRPRDMAKIGQLMLNKGQWGGIQVVSPEWVAESTQAHTTIMPGQRYGYQWWRENQPIYLETVNPYFAAGFGGQLISVYPDQNMVVVVTSDTANHTQNSARIMYLRNKYLLPATIPALMSKVILWSWYILTAGGLIFLALEIVRGHIKGFGWSVIWLLIAALSGPLGIADYLLSYRNKKTMKASGWKALGLSVFVATGNVTAVIILAVFQRLFLPAGSVILLVIPVSFLGSWLVFIALLTTCTRGMRYWKAVRQTLLTALITSCFALVGIFPVLVLLSIRWFPYDVDLASPLFWIMMTACGIAAAVVVYPFSLWTVRRNLDLWLVGRVEGHEIETSGIEKRLPRFRDAWGAFSLGLILLIAVFGFLILSLS